MGCTEEDYYLGYHFEGKAALRHLFRVAASLESMVLGESQILGQLKEALQATQSYGLTVDNHLIKSFQIAFETAKKVRQETGIGSTSVSVANLGISRLKCLEVAHPLDRVVVVGRSPIALIFLQWFKKNRPNCRLIWVNRSIDKIKDAALSFSAEVISLEDFLANPCSFTHLITATASREPLFDVAFFQKQKIKSVVVDFAEPADVKVCSELASTLELIRLDGLKSEAKENAKTRRSAVMSSETIIEKALREFCLSQKEAPLIKEFSTVGPKLVETLSTALQSLPNSHQQMGIWAEKLVKKNFHESREHLKTILRNIAET